MNLDDVKLTLENDRDFYAAYLEARAGHKYAVINEYVDTLYGSSDDLSQSDMQELRTYFNDRYLDQGIALSAIEREQLSAFRHERNPTTTAPSPELQEPTVSTQATAFFETRHFLKGQDLSVTTPEAIYQAIAGKEADIKKLEAIENKPKSLIKQIEQSRADIKALVEYLDSKEAA